MDENQAAVNPVRPKRKYTQVSNELREHIAQACAEAEITGKTHKDIAKQYRVNIRQVRSIWKVFREEGRAFKRPRRHKAPKLNADQQSALVAHSLDNPHKTNIELQAWVQQEFQIDVSSPLITRILRKRGVAYNVATYEPERRNTPAVKQQRKTYIEDFFIPSTAAGRRLYYIDEFPLWLSLRQRRGRSRRGHAPVLEGPGHKGKRVSVVACIEERIGLVYFEVHRTSIDGQIFSSFFDNLLRAVDDELPGYESGFVLDNASIHMRDTLNRALHDMPHCTLQFLPVYSPMLNPIENMFAIWKNEVKSIMTRVHVNSIEEFESVVQQASQVVTVEKVRKSCQHVHKFVPDCLKMNDIVDD